MDDPEGDDPFEDTQATKPEAPRFPEPSREPKDRLPTEPWMKYTGISMGAGLVSWLRIPRKERSGILRAAFIAMLLFGTALAAVAGLIWLYNVVKVG